MQNLRELISHLNSSRDLVEIDVEVDPHLELAEIHRRVIAASGPALLFKRVKGSSFPVVTNLFGTHSRVEAAFGRDPQKLVRSLVELATKQFPPSFSTLWKKRHDLLSLLKMGTRFKRNVPLLDVVNHSPDLHRLPMIKSWPLDGGSFLTLPLVYTESISSKTPNLGMYRIQRHDDKKAGLHWQIAKGGGFHYHEAEQLGKPLPVSIFLGGPPALILSAIAPLPENVPELLLAGLVAGGKLSRSSLPGHPHPLIGECEFAILGESSPHQRHPEGPFGDHYGYYSWQHDFPFLNIKTIAHRRDAIYPATVVGKPYQEDYYIGNYLQELLSPLFPVVMPGVKALWSYGETGFHSLAAAQVRERYERECMSSAFRILGEGQLALTKFLLLTDQTVHIKNIRQVLTTILERFRPEKDLYILANLSLDTLDYTGPSLNKGSRGILLGTGEPIRKLPHEFVGSLPSKIRDARPFCPGCLVLEGDAKDAEEMERLCREPDFQSWPLLILVDSLKKSLKDIPSFLWTTFTRFEPAADIYAGKKEIFRHHLCYSGPILIDARMKPSYPQEVLCDEATSLKVTKRWNEYFPHGMAMGDSNAGHVV